MNFSLSTGPHPILRAPAAAVAAGAAAVAAAAAAAPAAATAAAAAAAAAAATTAAAAGGAAAAAVAPSGAIVQKQEYANKAKEKLGQKRVGDVSGKGTVKHKSTKEETGGPEGSGGRTLRPAKDHALAHASFGAAVFLGHCRGEVARLRQQERAGGEPEAEGESGEDTRPLTREVGGTPPYQGRGRYQLHAGRETTATDQGKQAKQRGTQDRNQNTYLSGLSKKCLLEVEQQQRSEREALQVEESSDEVETEQGERQLRCEKNVEGRTCAVGLTSEKFQGGQEQQERRAPARRQRDEVWADSRASQVRSFPFCVQHSPKEAHESLQLGVNSARREEEERNDELEEAARESNHHLPELLLEKAKDLRINIVQAAPTTLPSATGTPQQHHAKVQASQQMTVRGMTALVLRETGSTHSLVSCGSPDELQLDKTPLRTPASMLLGNGKHVELKEAAIGVKCKAGDLYFKVSAIIAPIPFDFILGLPFFSRERLIWSFAPNRLTGWRGGRRLELPIQEEEEEDKNEEHHS
ncbi:hypothetical protein Efla_005219 [Eimeria flavescens]